MARPRKFQTEDAIEGAMQIFWRQGFCATNLPDLLQAMGLTRGSFYKAFGDKRTIYILALKRYDETNIEAAVRLLADDSLENGRARVVKLFQTAFSNADDHRPRRGCLLCNAMVELAPTDPEVASLTKLMCAKMQGAVGNALAVWDDAVGGKLDQSTLDLQATAITNLYLGAQAVSKTGQSAPEWKAMLGKIVST